MHIKNEIAQVVRECYLQLIDDIEAIRKIFDLLDENQESVSDTFDEVLGLHDVRESNTHGQDTDSSMVSDESALGKRTDDGKYCTCGNPSGEGNIHFQGHENLIYTCIDCGKQVED